MKNQEEITSDYVCESCGEKYLTEVQKKRDVVYTCHVGECSLCREEKVVTHIRLYNYLIKK